MAGKRLHASVLGGTRRLLSLFFVVALFSGLLLAVQPVTAGEAAQSCQAQHVVRAGETLAGIGRQYGLGWPAIAQANNLADANRIYSGQVLCIPPAGTTPPPAPTCIATHVVQAGQTLAAIGRQYNVGWPAIAQANNLANANQIYAGQRLCIPGGSAAPPPAPATGSVSGVYYLNVRSGPGMSYDRLHVLSNGTQVTLLGRDSYGGWLKVRLADGSEGWVGSAYIATSAVIATLPVAGTTVPLPPPAAGTTGVVATYGLNLRTGPGTSYPVILALSQGMTVPVTHRNSDATWVRVTLPGGTVGWVSAPYLSLNTAAVNLPVWP